MATRTRSAGTAAGTRTRRAHDGPSVPADWLDLDPAELARRNPSDTAAGWAQAQAAARGFAERAEHPEVVERWEDVPAFSSEGEEADYWLTHTPGPVVQRELDRRAATWAAREAERPAGAAQAPKAPRKQAAPVSLRLEGDTVRRLRALAAKKGTKYQTLLKQFVVERLYEEEKREGLVA